MPIRRLITLRTLVICLAVLVPRIGTAQPAPDAADVLQMKLQGWLGLVFGSRLPPQLSGLRVTGDGAPYRIELPTGSADGTPPITADARPLPDGLMAIDAVRLPDPLRFRLEPPDWPHTGVELHTGIRAARAVFDYPHDVASDIALDLQAPGLVGTSDGHRVTLQAQRYDLHSALSQPAQPGGRRDLNVTATLTGLYGTTESTHEPPRVIRVDRVHATAHVEAIEFEHAFMLPPDIVRLAATAPLAGVLPADGQLSPAARAALRTLAAALRGVANAVRSEMIIDGLRTTGPDDAGMTVQHARVGLDLAAAQQRVRIGFDAALDGAAATGAPGEALPVVPRRAALHLGVDGLSVTDLARMAQQAADAASHADRLTDDVAALLEQDGATVTLDRLNVDFGVATLRGEGQIRFVGANERRGDVRLVATGFNDLVRAMSARGPGLQPILLFLALLRGFGHAEGNTLVWRIVAGPGGISVNGLPIDVLAQAAPHPDRR